MKYFIVFALVAGLCALAQAQEQSCQVDVRSACGTNAIMAFFSDESGVSNCNARYAAIGHLEGKLQNYIQLQLKKSYEYLLLATHFNSYQMNRPGFQKLYQGLSDRAFDDTIELIRQVTRRGGSVDFSKPHQHGAAEVPEVHLNELESLARALDVEKELTTGAIHVHTSATHSSNENREHDPEMAHYIQENFLSKQAKSVRTLSGYANDLAKLVSVKEPSLSVYLFDEYLQKQ
ncbi:ferritin light chain isoform X1 [Drosophila sulfurigaster albostrigata]|uniref:ferritin light chain isoform X1 n=1 Tax=Drosophila sulfurigaster albostrigata TaxID=89887 RepID=UPI001470C027|nr:ferritin light chain isoform X1 [Drosophila sulfurigaster albostrigata]